MKIKLLTLAFALVALISCDKSTFKVDVEITNANGKAVYLQRIINNENVNVDSAIIKNNNVVFNVRTDENNDVYHLFIAGWKRALPFFADNNDVSIKGDFNAYHKINISASETQRILDETNRKIDDLDSENIKLFITEYVKTNSLNELAPYMIYRYKWAFNLNELQRLTKLFPRDFKASYYYKLIDYIKILERTDVGKQYIDFTLNNIDGQPVKLSSLMGDNKLVMLDFWASWCPDCRAENPNVVAVYNEFKDKGLDVISVSLDTDKNAWVAGIEKDGLVWENHLSDLQGWNSSAASEYGVAFIPQNVIINDEGIIVAKNLDGEKLKGFVSRYFRN